MDKLTDSHEDNIPNCPDHNTDESSKITCRAALTSYESSSTSLENLSFFCSALKIESEQISNLGV